VSPEEVFRIKLDPLGRASRAYRFLNSSATPVRPDFFKHWSIYEEQTKPFG
jgi:hypothetical protein